MPGVGAPGGALLAVSCDSRTYKCVPRTAACRGGFRAELRLIRIARGPMSALIDAIYVMEARTGGGGGLVDRLCQGMGGKTCGK